MHLDKVIGEGTQDSTLTPFAEDYPQMERLQILLVQEIFQEINQADFLQ